MRELADYLRARGHEVMVLAPLRARVAPKGIVPIGRTMNVRYGASVAPIDPWPWHVSRVRKILGSFGPDVVHAHEPVAPSTGMWTTLASAAPVVGTFHSGADRSLLFDLSSPLLKRLLRRVGVRIAVSSRARDFAATRLGGDYHVIPNGVDVDRFAGVEARDLGPGRKLLFVGRLHPRKGFLTAVAAFELLARGRPDLRLIVAGDGEQRDALGLLSPELASRVLMLGTVSYRVLPSIYAACDAYLSPATGGESFGVVLIEAMASGMPVVASAIPGYDEVVRDGHEGFLVPPGDPEGFAEALGPLLDDPAWRRRMGSAGKERARMFDWGVVGAKIEELYARAAGGGGADTIGA